MKHLPSFRRSALSCLIHFVLNLTLVKWTTIHLKVVLKYAWIWWRGNRSLCTRFDIYAFILWRHLPSSCCLNLVPPSTINFSGLQISFSGFLPELFEISKNGLLHLTLHTSAQNILNFQVPRFKALRGVWAQSLKMSCLLYNNRFYRNFRLMMLASTKPLFRAISSSAVTS